MVFLTLFITTALFSAVQNNVLNNFLDFKTIKDWVSDKNNNYKTLNIINKKFFQQIKHWSIFDTFGMDAQVIEASYFWQNPRNREGIFPALMLPLLVAVKNENRSLGIIEICGGHGNRVWPLLYAVNSTVWFCVQDHTLDKNKLNIDAFDLVVNDHIERLKATNTTVVISKLFEQDCFQLLKRPSMRGAFDFLNAYNLIHNFNPIEHNYFLLLINYLLKENGKAFISGRTINYSNPTDSIVAFVTEREKHVRPYHGFVAITALETYKKYGDFLIPLNVTITDVKVPNNIDDHCDAHCLLTWSQFVKKNNESYQELYQQTFEIVNYFTKSALKSAVKSVNFECNTQLKIDEIYFVSPCGERIQKSQLYNQETAFIAAIISKKARE